MLEDGLKIISSYLPLDIIQENYNEEESYYMVDEEYDTIEYWKYYRIKDGKETPEKMDYSFYICSILRLKKHLLKRELRGQNQFSVIGRYFSQGLVFHSSRSKSLWR